MEYAELRKLLDSRSPMIDLKVDSINTMQDFLDRVFWRGSATTDNTGDYWDFGTSPTTAKASKELYDILVKITNDPKTNGDIQFTYSYFDENGNGKHDKYTMKVVEAYNRNVVQGARTWWTTKQYTDPSVPAPPKEWAYATVIEMTRQGDPDALRIYQTYGEPHGVWEWELRKMPNPMAINQLRFG